MKCLLFFSPRKQWREGDSIPSSWKQYYQYNPCVPIDYYDINTALNEVIGTAKEDPLKPRGIRVLLRPGRHVLQKAITIEDTFLSKHPVSIDIETMAHSPGTYYNSDYRYNFTQFHQSSDQPKQKFKKSLKKFFGCATVDLESGEEEANLFVDDDIVDYTRSARRNDSTIDTLHGKSVSHSVRESGNKTINRATLILKTRRQNEPLFRVRQGSFCIRNITLKHESFGNGKSILMNFHRWQ